jgi:hypothetical protein
LLTRIAYVVFGILLFLFLIALLAGAGIAWWVQARNASARKWIETEVARIQAAGEPITEVDCYAYEAARKLSPDVTLLWLEAIDAYNREQVFEDGVSLPFVGDAAEETLAPDAEESTFSAAQEFLKKHEAVLKAAHAAARQPGQCFFPFRYEEGLEAKLDSIIALRPLSRLLHLQLRVRALEGDVDGAIESLETVVAASSAVNQQLVPVEYLLSLGIAQDAMEESLFLASHHPLEETSLARMQSFLARLDPRGGLRPAIYGERATMYNTFHHLGARMDIPSLRRYDGQLVRPVDCQTYLQWSRELIEFSYSVFPKALDQARQFEGRIEALQELTAERFWHFVTETHFPAALNIFEHCAKGMARKETAITAIAAQRFRLRHGAYPRDLKELVPEFLAAEPKDPFTGELLKLVVQGEELVIYSVGKNGKDDGGGAGEQQEPLDIVARVRVRDDKEF